MKFSWNPRKFFSGILLFLLILFALNVRIMSKLEKSLRIASQVKESPAGQSAELVKEIIPRSEQLDQPLPDGLVTDAADDYGIGVEHEQAMNRSQMQWDFELKRSRDYAGHLKTSDRQEKIVRVQKSPEEYAAQLKLLDEQIRELEVRVKRNPYDDKGQERLQSLYMLRATLSIFKKDIVKDKPSF